MTGKRLNWIDGIKGFLMLCVIIGHTIDFESTMCMLIHSFHIPLFFVISGYTIRKVSTGELSHEIYKDIKRLIVPAVVARIIYFIMGNEIMQENTVRSSILNTIKRIMWGVEDDSIMMLLGNNYRIPGIGFLWFLFALFVGKFAFRLLLYIPDIVRISIEIIGTVITVFVQNTRLVLLPWSLDLVFVILLFMELGHQISAKNTLSKKNTKYVACVCAVFWIVSVFGFGTYIQIAGRLFKHGIISVMVALAASFVLICVFSYVEKIENVNVIKIVEKSIHFIGRNSIDLYIIHFFDGYLIDLWYGELVSKNPVSLYTQSILRIIVDVLVLILYVTLRDTLHNVVENKK